MPCQSHLKKASGGVTGKKGSRDDQSPLRPCRGRVKGDLLQQKRKPGYSLHVSKRKVIPSVREKGGGKNIGSL